MVERHFKHDWLHFYKQCTTRPNFFPYSMKWTLSRILSQSHQSRYFSVCRPMLLLATQLTRPTLLRVRLGRRCRAAGPWTSSTPTVSKWPPRQVTHKSPSPSSTPKNALQRTTSSLDASEAFQY